MALDGTPRNIVRWECVRQIRDRDWLIRIVWHDGRAWFSCGPVGGPVRSFDRAIPKVTPELCNHFIRLVIRFANAL